MSPRLAIGRRGHPWRLGLVVCACASFAAPHDAHAAASNLLALSENLQPGPLDAFELGAALRLRSDALVNLDLDRGLTPSGAPLYPVPLGDPLGQLLWTSDVRARFDLALHGPGTGVTLHTRVDALDDVALGSPPDGKPPSRTSATPAATTGQRSPANALELERLYGEVQTPVGLLVVGRMGSHFGLGMVANSGDCRDCDHGDSADRIAFVTPVLGHVVAAAFDWSASGPWVARTTGARTLDLDPTDDVRTVSVALGDFASDATRRRHLRADRHTLEYGVVASYRWQTNDAPYDYLSASSPLALSPATVVGRGYGAWLADGWLRWAHAGHRIELEGAILTARVDEPSLIPGVTYGEPVLSRQLGAALETEVALVREVLVVGVDAGAASGDSAPAFGAFPMPLAPAPQAGELEGPQANPPFDRSINNFRFHPDYHVDRILFRELIGTVTDAAYVRPHIAWFPVRNTLGRLEVSAATVASRALFAESTPGGAEPLGVELDLACRWTTNDGLHAALSYAHLWPLAGLDNPETGLAARGAQALELLLALEL